MCKVVRQKKIAPITGEGELQHLHSRQIKLIAQRSHLLRHHTQIFGDDRKIAQRRFKRVEKNRARPLDPLAHLRRRHPKRNLPIGFKAAKVIEPRDVHHRQRRAEALDPPRIIISLQHIPAIQRVAPQLTGRAEIIRRHARHHRRLAMFVKKK